MSKRSRKIIGWIIYFIGLMLMVELTDTFIQFMQLVFGSILTIIGNNIIDER